MFFHVKRFDRFRIIKDEYRSVRLVRDKGFMRRTKIIAPDDIVKSVCVQQSYGIIIADAVVRQLRIFFQQFFVALQRIQVDIAIIQHRLDQISDVFFLDFQTLVLMHEGHFRLHHPEFDQVAACFRFFGTESRAE
ncbi:hypothetical protein SDC9_197002 [bioreactor metagenome]|uniref:Uncharacterized protein n=1 Tax=bioreactor metagenome TaxID=1076179 RepID=A0A645IEX3_9ZZZZ